MAVAVLSLVFSILFIWYSRNTGQPFWLYWAPFLLAAVALLLGVPVYRAQRSKMSQALARTAAALRTVARRSWRLECGSWSHWAGMHCCGVPTR